MVDVDGVCRDKMIRHPVRVGASEFGRKDWHIYGPRGAGRKALRDQDYASTFSEPVGSGAQGMVLRKSLGC